MKSLITSACLLLALLLPVTASAGGVVIPSDFEEDGLYYNVIDDGNAVEVTSPPATGYTGPVITIPAAVTHDGTTYPVTGIGNGAFMYADDLTSVVIPNSVTTIGRSAFGGCDGLTSMNISRYVTSIGESAFWGCSGITSLTVDSQNPNYDSRNNCNAIIETASNTLIAGCRNTVIPNNVMAIGTDAFWHCRGLLSVTIPSSVTVIGDGAFGGCDALTSVTIPNSVISIGREAFAYCDGLTEIAIPNSVKTIGPEAFRYSKGLTSVTIGNSVTTIGDAAFAECESLESVTIGKSVSSIGLRVFDSCGNMSSLVVASDNTTYDSRNNCNAVIETASNTLIIGSINTVIPGSVTTIADRAFYGRGARLTSLTIPSSVTAIGIEAFANCGITSLAIPNSVTTLGARAFGGCAYLRTLTIGNSLTIIPQEAFLSCRSLTSLTIPGSVTTIGENAFSICEGLTSLSIGNSVTTIGKGAFTACRGLSSVTIPNSVTTIGEGAFRVCTSLTRVTIGNSVQSIAVDAFEACMNLSNIVVASGNTTFDSRNNCNAIIETASNTLIIGCKNSVIPGTVTTIGQEAFAGCSGLTSVTFPGSVTTIDHRAFRGCTGLTSITFPNSVIVIGYEAFDHTAWYDNQPYGLVYAGLVAYKYKREPMAPDVTSITLRNGTLGIAGGAFYNCRSLTSITIPNTVKAIGYMAFGDCSSLRSLTIPSSVTIIGRVPFTRCSALTRLVVASGNTTFDSRDNCNAIIETASNTLIAGCPGTVIPNTVTTIGEAAFWYCDSLKQITIPNSVTTIGTRAFMSCGGLASVTIPNSVTAIGNHAFEGCWDLADVYSYITDLSRVAVGNDEFWIYYFGQGSFNWRTLHVLPGMADAYRADEHWYPYFGQIVEDLEYSYVRGDVNGDGSVNIADVNAVISIILGAPAAADVMLRADVNSDGSINIADLNAIIQIILGTATPTPVDHEWVDLGLPSGTLWATTNVGAVSPEDYGDYFAWGETEPKESYSWETYKWCNGTYSTMTKYCTRSGFSVLDGKTELDLEDDAAYVNWGESWRMPNEEQIHELLDCCSSRWTKVNDVNGLLVTGPNGNTMFLPAAGARNGSVLESAGASLHYWSLSLDPSSNMFAYLMGYFSGDWGLFYGYRSYGFSVRPVHVPQN